jgi:TrmH family RNA methyltransferase
VAVVLVEPGHAGNVAATARVMVVNGLVDLRLVNPQCGDPAEEPWLAWGAEEILRRSRRFETLAECLQDASFAVGCTRRIRRRGWPQLDPVEAARTVRQESSAAVAALVFGPERTGLHRSHLELCQARSAIPQRTDHPSYNLSHAVAIYAYELTRAGRRRATTPPEAAAGSALQALRAHLASVLASRGPGGQRLARDLYRLWLRARPTEGELRLLHRAILLMGARLTRDGRNSDTPLDDDAAPEP